MSNLDMNLQLFAVDVPETAKELRRMQDDIWKTPTDHVLLVYQVAYLKGIEEDVSAIMREGGTQSCIMRDCSNHLKEIASSLKAINESLRLIAGRME